MMKCKIHNSAILVFSVVLLASLSACKTTKQSTKTRTDVTTSINSDIETNTKSNVDVAVKSLDTRKTVQTDSMVISEIEVVYSKPDSTGVQYPEKITSRETRIVSKDKEETNRARDSTSSTNYNQTVSEKTDLKSDEQTNSVVKIKSKFRTPRYVIGAMTILMILGYFILRRFKLF